MIINQDRFNAAMDNLDRENPIPLRNLVQSNLPGAVTHLKRGTAYRVLFAGILQTDKPLSDNAVLVTYMGDDGVPWHRAHEEFGDGRFGMAEAMPAPIDPAPFLAEDYAHTADLIQRYAKSGDNASLKAVMSNNMNIILAALQAARRGHP